MFFLSMARICCTEVCGIKGSVIEGILQPILQHVAPSLKKSSSCFSLHRISGHLVVNTCLTVGENFSAS